MAIQFQFRRGTDTDHATFTGAEGEVTVDITNDTLVIHDGVTQGGFPLARASSVPTALSQLTNDVGFVTSGNFTETTTTLSFANNVLSYTNEDGVVTNIDMSVFLDDTDTNLARLVSGSLNETTGLLTLVRDDASTFTVDLSSLVNDPTQVTLTGTGATTVSGTYPNFTITSTDTTYTNATSSLAGLMSSADKTKLDGVAANANNYIHPTTAGNLHIPAGGSAGQVLGWASNGAAQWIPAPTSVGAINDLSDVNTVGAVSGNVLSFNGTGWVAGTVTVPTNTSDLVNDSGFLTTETDPVFTAWDKSSGITITESQISDLKSYLTSETVTSMTINANILSYTDENSNTTNIDLSQFLDNTNLTRITNGSFDSGTGILTLLRSDATVAATIDLNGRYLTSYSETDPVFTASVAAGISAPDITNWNTSFGWGDHSTAGYLTSVSLNSLTDVNTTGAINGSVLKFNNGTWTVGVDNAGEAGTVTLADLSVTQLPSSGAGTLTYNNTNGAFSYTPPDLTPFMTSYTETDPVVGAVNGLVKSDGLGTISAAVPGTDYVASESVTSLNLAANVLSYVDENGVTTNLDLSLYLDDTNLARIVSGTLDGVTGIATFTRDDASTFTVDMSALLDDVQVTITGGGATTITGTYPNFTVSSTDTTYNNATTSVSGLMSSTDKTKIDGVEVNANNYVHPTTPGNLHIPSGGTSGQLLGWAADGAAQWIPAPVQNISDLNDVDTTGAISGNVLSFNGISWQPNSLSIPTNTSDLVNDSGFLTSFTETDPVFSASAAAAIGSPQIANWDTAFGWGDHSTAGYLTSYTETDPIFTASAAFGIGSPQIANWDTAFSWGDHALAGYLTSFTETDPVFSASAAAAIGSPQIANWDAAYGWGNHALAGYLTTETVTSLSLVANTLTFVDENGATTNLDLSLYLDDTNLARIVSGTLDGVTGIATFTRDDASTFTVDMSALLDDVQVSITGGGATTVTGSYPNFTISSTDTTYAPATVSVSGLMSAADKAKLDGIQAGATANTTTVSTSAPTGGVDGDMWYQI